MTKNYTLKGLYGEADEESGGTLPSGSSLMRWGVGCLVLFLLMGACGTVYGFANNWFAAGTSIVSPENVKAQFQQAYDDINALNAVAQNICQGAKTRDKYATGSQDYSTWESNVVAQEQNYQRISNHYNAYIHDPFRAQVVRPRDLPDPAPSEQDLTSRYCPGQNI